MSKPRTTLTERKNRLIAQVAAERTMLARDLIALQLPLQRIDQALSVIRFFRRHPSILVLGGTLLAWFRSRFAWKTLRRGWCSWRPRDRSP
jgi:hypothetical protein